jgi:hypothetical protein
MKIKLLIIITVVSIAIPATSYGFGLLRWGWDAVANQVGLDRGPIPKVIPKIGQPKPDPRDRWRASYARYPWFYIQAEGF